MLVSYCVASVVCITLVCIRLAHFPRGMLGSVQHDSYSMFYRLSMNLIFYSNKEGPLLDPLLFIPLFSMPIVESALFNGISPQFPMLPTLSLSNVIVESALFNGISPQFPMLPTLSLSNVVSRFLPYKIPQQ